MYRQIQPLVSPEVSATAQEVRKWAEYIAEKEKRSRDLCGLCMRASVRLYNLLKQKNINASLCTNFCHVFVLLGDVVIDITASQFTKYQDVDILICHTNELSEYYHQNYQEFIDFKEFIEHQRDHLWTTDKVLQENPICL